MLTWKLKQSKQCDQLFVAPGNAGTAQIAKNVSLSLSDFEAIKKLVISENIELVIVGPEAPLVDGIRDFFEADADLKRVAMVGPDSKGAMLEGSKDFSKLFMEKYGIPTAAYKTFTKEQLNKGLAYLESCQMPIVLKADGLAAGKGVIIAQDLAEAKSNLIEMLQDAKFGEASAKVVIEEFLTGIELSVFVLSDGKNYVLLPEAKDYKRIGEGDTGLNTGGMGAVSPVPFADQAFLDKVKERIIAPTLSGLQQENITYKGFIFIGLMNVNGEPYVIEYNARMGDPETQAVIPRVQTDFVEMMLATHQGKLDQVEFTVDPRVHTTVVLVAGGYPGSYKKGLEISGLDHVNQALLFHAGTKQEGSKVLTDGGRVLAVTGVGTAISEALKNAYAAANAVCWEGIYYRKDVGQDLLKY